MIEIERHGIHSMIGENIALPDSRRTKNRCFTAWEQRPLTEGGFASRKRERLN